MKIVVQNLTLMESQGNSYFSLSLPLFWWRDIEVVSKYAQWRWLNFFVIQFPEMQNGNNTTLQSIVKVKLYG